MPRYGRVENWVVGREARVVLERMLVLYAAEVAMTDHWLGKLLTRLRQLDLERKTVVVLVSDHGIQLGERGWLGRITTELHPELIQVPLIIADPSGRRAGAQTDYYASTHDLARTLLSMLDVPAPPGMAGVDLSSLLRNAAPSERPYTYGGWSNHHFVRTDEWAYVADNGLVHPRLFHLADDPQESCNVAAEHGDVVAELSGLVEQSTGGSLPVYAE